MTALEIAFVAGIAALGCGVSMPLVIRWLRTREVIDEVSGRSSHATPTLRGGGLAVVIGTGVGAGAAATISSSRWQLACAGAVLVCFAALGLADDLRGLSARRRLATQLLLAPVAAWALLTPSTRIWALAAGILSATLWIVWFVNAFNFMDGINGISAATATIVGSSYAVSASRLDATDVLALALALAGASVAFLPFNFPRAQVFLGDVGSYFLGAGIAMIGIRLLWAGAPPVEVIAPVALYCVDTGTTLLRRVRRGDRWWEPHREHAYQRLANGTLGHTRTTLLVTALTAILCIGALAL